MSDTKLSRGVPGAVLKLLGAGDYTLTLTNRREISPHYLRLTFEAGGMLDDRALHPTMWIRMWFADGDKLHQRGYTLVDPDPEAGTVDIEFALHDGVAANFDASDHFGWVACDNRTTRAAAKVLREHYRIPRKSIKAQAYWVA